MSQRETKGALAMPGVERSPAQTKPERKRGHMIRTRQDLWEDTSWSSRKWSRASPGPRGPRARSLARDRVEASPQNTARERSRVRTLRQAFLALQAALPAVPLDTKLSKLDVLVLATSYIAHLTRTLGHDSPGPTWPPFLRGLRYLHPLKKWPMRSRLYTGGLWCSSFDSTTAPTSSQRPKETEANPRVCGEAGALLPTGPPSPALADQTPMTLSSPFGGTSYPFGLVFKNYGQRI
ncbi:transcription factor 23 isoform X2 [Erinaceus europaeus]|uniref:Transcription factor 23 isoform X2 n=1 Tax=Erinaceus europaeus TaxID=9365 RepID=A0ABM3X1K6_ERIEU|nr:transcription factor 23 isoform X2 [Erinaceus europaeus]